MPKIKEDEVNQEQQEETNNEFVELKQVNHVRCLCKACRKKNKRTA